MEEIKDKSISELFENSTLNRSNECTLHPLQECSPENRNLDSCDIDCCEEQELIWKKAVNPVELIPKIIWLKQRHIEVDNAIRKYSNANLKVPSEWFREWYELSNLITIEDDQ